MWLSLSILSAFFLGIYDVAKKYSLNNNAVFPVLIFSTMTSGLVFLPLLIASQTGCISSQSLFFIPSIDVPSHLLLVLKSAIVLTSWIFIYYGLKQLPLSFVSPIRATAPIWTMLGAISFLGERLNAMQWVGVTVTIVFLILFSLSGKREGISIKNNKWLWFILIGTLTGAASALYDKFLIIGIHPMAVQCYNAFYQILMLLPLTLIFWFPAKRKGAVFKWRWSIPLIGIFLLVADFLYFYALSLPGSLIALVSPLRRSNAIVSFSLAAILLKEKNIWRKAIFLAGITTGIVIIFWGSL